jgi:hypothetical protein
MAARDAMLGQGRYVEAVMVASELILFLNDRPSVKEVFNLRSGTQVEVTKFFLNLRKWRGQPIANTYGNKAVLDWKGEPVFAELAVVKLFQSQGWEGVWVDSYGRKFRVGLPGVVEPIQIPPDKQRLIEGIGRKAGKAGGCWDVAVWKPKVMLFLEIKRRKKDKIRPSQIEWLEASLEIGLSPNNFALVEWDCCADALA